VALAEVRDETCTLCRVRVRPHVYQELRRENSEEIFHCESCTRILYCSVQPVAQASAGGNES
jgi:predicted  nucleic acid-binding Zn-ribbon protein